MSFYCVPVPVCRRNWLTFIRKAKGLSIIDFSKLCGLSHETIGKLERGKSSSSGVSVKAAMIVGKELHVPIEVFMHKTSDDGKISEPIYYLTLLPVLASVVGKENLTYDLLSFIFTDEVIETIKRIDS